MEFNYVEKLIIEDEEIFEQVKKNFNPEDVFEEEQLHAWAKENHYEHEDD